MKFLKIKTISEAKKALEDHFSLTPMIESIDVRSGLQRVLANDLSATLDVPPFDRSKMDGYAVLAQDTFTADENTPIHLKKIGSIAAGDSKTASVKKGCAVMIATGAAIPEGANAVQMVEFTRELPNGMVEIQSSVVPGENIAPAGSDISTGEILLRKMTVLASRHLGILASQGIKDIEVIKNPKIALLSTGNEIISPGKKLKPGKVYDINSYSLSNRVRECGGIPISYGIIKDSKVEIESTLKNALKEHDIIITSGGTSKGTGDLLSEVIDSLGDPGVIVHGVSMKPGKPIIIGVIDKKLVFGLPGNPLSALMAFNVFVSDVIQKLSGIPKQSSRTIKAENAARINNPLGRHVYQLVHVVKSKNGEFHTYPVTKGSGAITAINEADGYIEIQSNTAIIEKGEPIDVVLIEDEWTVADITFVGSHCLGVEVISKLAPFKMKVIYVGSTGGLSAIKRGESDIAGMHLLYENGKYNSPFMGNNMVLVKGYTREQGLMVKKGNPKNILGIEDLIRKDIIFINRNPGSGTKVLLLHELKTLGIDENNVSSLSGEVKSHSAVAAAVALGKADVGLGIKAAALNYNLHFIPIKKEEYDFAIPKDKQSKKEIVEFIALLKSQEFKNELEKLLGLKTSKETGRIIDKHH
jgi:putative molybdopterin biosynthesis protein